MTYFLVVIRITHVRFVLYVFLYLSANFLKVGFPLSLITVIESILDDDIDWISE